MSKNDAFLAFAQKVLETVDQDGAEAGDARGRACRARGQDRRKHRDSGRLALSTGTATRQSPPTSILPRTRSRHGEDPWLSRAREAAGDGHLLSQRRDTGAANEVPGEEVEAERTIYKNPTRSSRSRAGPPEHRRRMLRKRFFAQTVLLDQEWIHESGKTVEKVPGAGRRGARLRALRPWRLIPTATGRVRQSAAEAVRRGPDGESGLRGRPR